MDSFTISPAVLEIEGPERDCGLESQRGGNEPSV